MSLKIKYEYFKADVKNYFRLIFSNRKKVIKPIKKLLVKILNNSQEALNVADEVLRNGFETAENKPFNHFKALTIAKVRKEFGAVGVELAVYEKVPVYNRKQILEIMFYKKENKEKQIVAFGGVFEKDI